MHLTDREKAFEEKFAHDEELLFKIRAKRNKLVGMWAAGRMGKSGDSAHEYADRLVIEMLDKEHLHQRLKADFKAAGEAMTDSDLQAKLNEFITQARKYFMENF